MKKSFITIIALLSVCTLIPSACQPTAAPQGQSAGDVPIKVLAAESFIADIAQNVAGDRLKIETLMPLGLDPHAFEPTPQDVARISESDVLIINGNGFEEWLQEVIKNAGGERMVIEASHGLASRVAREGEAAALDPSSATPTGEDHQHEGDPHFWLDPTKVITYVENIRDGLIEIDPAGKDIYTANTTAYVNQLKELDQEISQQITFIPKERRLIVTNHESFGYFADRYGFTIIGTIVPSVSSSASPSAQELARLIDRVKESKTIAIFLETGTNPQLAEQVSRETGVKVVTGLYTHSITAADGEAPTYIDMMKVNVKMIVDALK